MSVIFIIALCVLLLVAYLFDISSRFTKIPSVILLMSMGFGVKYLLLSFNYNLAPPQELLPILGSIGLILIVLEGSLELEVSKDKNGLIAKAFFMSLLPMILLIALVSFILYYISFDYTVSECLLNAVPLAVISSAIAIPSAKNLKKSNKEFVTYESSFSDILGVIFFNFLMVNSEFTIGALGSFTFEFLIMVIFALIATIVLAFLLNRINHHVKFIPIILLVILIYEISKLLHLPGLIFVMIFGLFLGNLDQLKKIEPLKNISLDKLKGEVHRFNEIVIETAFVIRASFFILFGYVLNANEIVNLQNLPLSLEIFSAMLLLRTLFLFLFKLPVFPLVFVAPRGLITILLFLSIPATQMIPEMNNSVIVQVILLSALWMMFGLMLSKSDKKKTPAQKHEGSTVQ